MKKTLHLVLLVSALTVITISCYRLRGPNGGGQIDSITPRIINANDIGIQPGYSIEPVISGLTFPTAVCFDDKNNLYFIEAGYSYGEVWGEPKLLSVEADGTTKLIAKGEKNGPWTGLAWHNGAFYISEGGQMEGGKILRVTPGGQITALVTGLPSVGDHHTNVLVIKDDYIYFGQGVATNSAVVGTDNAEFGWLTRKKDFHDIPCDDITLAGQNYTTENILTDDPDDETSTGAYVPFGTSTTPGQVIKGAVPCTGSVMRIPINGGKAELVAWGFRNPFGIAVDPGGRLFITENGFDERGSRPVWGSGDALWEIKQGLWYGWPDFSEGKPIKNDEEFKSPGKPRVKPLLQKYPNTPPKPAAIFGVHSSSNGFDFSKNPAFGFTGDAFVAQFGDMSGAGKVLYPVGFKIVRANVNTGVVRDFASNKGKRNGPASWLGNGGLERPVSVKFNLAGTALYVVDFGIMKTTKEGISPQPKTGMIWKITKK